MIKAVIFDFDGIIVESAGIKTSAFRELFAQDFPGKLKTIIDYHIKNMGISRFVKFRYIYENILKLPLSKEQEEELGRKFSDIVFEKILIAPFVRGAIEFLRMNQKKYHLFIVSGTPDKELQDILRLRQISGLFKEAHGSPAQKSQIIKDIMNRYSLGVDEIVFVGDAESDFIASQETGVEFIARLSPDTAHLLQNAKWKIGDLQTLDSVIKDIEETKVILKKELNKHA